MARPRKLVSLIERSVLLLKRQLLVDAIEVGSMPGEVPVIEISFPNADRLPIYVTDAGSQIYEGPAGSTAENNLTAATVPLAVVHPDLVPEQLDAPATAVSGNHVTLTYTVRNSGTGQAAGKASFTYTVGSVSQTKLIERQPFGNAGFTNTRFSNNDWVIFTAP